MLSVSTCAHVSLHECVCHTARSECCVCGHSESMFCLDWHKGLRNEVTGQQDVMHGKYNNFLRKHVDMCGHHYHSICHYFSL